MAFPFSVAAARLWLADRIAPSQVNVARPMQRNELVQAAPAAVGVPMGGFDGASTAPRMRGFIPNRQHINSILAAEAPMLRGRVRQLVANTAYGANASETFATYATGIGIKPSPQLPTAQRKAVSQAWLDWTDEADADGDSDLYGLQNLASRALFDAGEVFIRFRDRFTLDGLLVPLQLQLLEAEQLDIQFISTAPNGNPIRCGIEFDKNIPSRRVAYHFFREHPGDATIRFGGSYERTRVPAESVIHIFKKMRPGQIRGRPWLTPGIVKLYDLDRYTDAELVRKLTATLFMAFVTQDLGEDIGTTGLVNDEELGETNDVDAAGTANIPMEPGAVPVLPRGHDVKFSEPSDVGPNFEMFMYRNLLELCASMGLPYYAVTGDTAKANYSSLRAALVECRRRIEIFQHQTLVFKMCRPIYNRWLPTAVISGAISLPGFAFNQRVMSRVNWIPPKWDWVDPMKDAQAEKLMVDAGFKSRHKVIEERGEEPEDVDDDIARSNESAARRNLSFATGTIAHTTPQEREPAAPSDDNQEAA